MPASITHELVAEEAKDLLPAAARETVLAAFDYYILGAQGPDLFFFYRPFSGREENLGRLLHRRQVYKFFSALAKAVRGLSPDAAEKALAYSLGFCSHLAADVVFHPFVYNYLAKHGEKKYDHQKIENDWDVYFLRELKSRSALSHSYPFDLGKIAREGVLYAFLEKVFSCLGVELRPASFGRMLRRFGRYLSHFHKGGARPLRLLGFGAPYPRPVPERAYLGGENFSRYAEGAAENADALFLHAAEESVSCMEAFLEASSSDMPLPKSLFSRSMHSGKNIPSD